MERIGIHQPHSLVLDHHAGVALINVVAAILPGQDGAAIVAEEYAGRHPANLVLHRVDRQRPCRPNQQLTSFAPMVRAAT